MHTLFRKWRSCEMMTIVRIARVEDVFQPADGVDVEVVGRLVQQQDVRIGEQRLRQQHAQLEAGRDFAHRPVVQLDRDAHAEQQLAGARFGGVAVVFGELRFQIGGAHVVFLGGIRIGVDRIALRHRLPHLGVAHHHHIQHAHVLVGELVLAQLAEALVLVQHHVAGSRLQIAAEDLHERGLAAAVGADQAVAVAVAEFDGDVFKQGLGPELHGDICGGKHGKHEFGKIWSAILTPRRDCVGRAGRGGVMRASINELCYAAHRRKRPPEYKATRRRFHILEFASLTVR